jgi:hypothetical protein
MLLTSKRGRHAYPAWPSKKEAPAYFGGKKGLGLRSRELKLRHDFLIVPRDYIVNKHAVGKFRGAPMHLF